MENRQEFVKDIKVLASNYISREYAIDDLHGRDPSQIWDTADVEVWINALPSVQPDVPDTNVGKLISKQDAIETALMFFVEYFGGAFREDDQLMLKKRMEELSSVQLERDIPIKPIETTDRAWGIPKKQAVCPKCDYYLGNISFLGDYKGKRITYCETCGQAIDWEGWDFDE